MEERGIGMEREKLSRIVGLRLLSIKEGAECGAIREVVLDVEKKTVEYLVLDTGKGCFGFCVLPNSKIAGMGKDFSITGTSEDVVSIWKEEDAMRLAYTDSDLIGARVVSSAGDVVGKIVDFEFQLIEGVIEKYIMEDGGVLPKECIVTLSRGIVFIDSSLVEDEESDVQSGIAEAEETAVAEESEVEEVNVEPVLEEPAVVESAAEEEVATEPDGGEEAEQESAAEDEAGDESAQQPEEEPVEEEETAAKPEEIAIPDQQEEQIAATAQSAEEAAPVADAPLASRLAALRNRAPAAAAGQNSDTKSYFERRRAEYVIGKTVKQRITAADGTVLADEGQTVTAEMVDKITAADKLTELTMGVG